MNSRARKRGYWTPMRSELHAGITHTWDLRSPDDVRLLFGSLDEDEVAEMVREATEAAKRPPAPPFVITHIDYDTKTVTLERKP